MAVDYLIWMKDRSWIYFSQKFSEIFKKFTWVVCSLIKREVWLNKILKERRLKNASLSLVDFKSAKIDRANQIRPWPQRSKSNPANCS